MTSCIGGINVAKTQNKHLELKPLDVDGFIKVNDVKEITDPVFFSSKNMPAPGGLLSNEIFGICSSPFLTSELIIIQLY